MTRSTTADTLIVYAARALAHRGDDGGEPVHRNNVGFNKADFYVVRRYLAEIDATGQVAAMTAWALGRIVAKYHRQLAELGIDLQHLDGITEDGWRALGALPSRTVPVPPWPETSWDNDAKTTMASILGPGGIIATTLPGYESRPTQVTLAQEIADALDERRALLAEAGTGTGKSIAYLIPAIYSGKKVIVSTEGKALQDQISKKDAPFLKAVLPVDFDFAVLKGLSNYVCRLKYADEATAQSMLGESHEFAQVRQWIETTEEGDLAEFPGALGSDLRGNVTASSDECLGLECPFHATCFGMTARARAEVVDVLVVNHTLLALDLAIRDRTEDGVAILPDRDVIVVDEAHALEDVATDAFTTEVSNWSVPSLLRGTMPSRAELDDATAQRARDASTTFFNAFLADPRTSFTVTPNADLDMAALSVREPLMALATQARRAASKGGKMIDQYAKRLSVLADTFGDVLETSDEHVIFIEKSLAPKTSRWTVTMKRAPITVAEDLRRALWAKWPVVATSATLATASGFRYFRERTGCDDGGEVRVASPFDFAHNALLYLPRDGALFDPSKYYHDGSVDYFERLATEIEALLLASDGRAFCLFTSRKALDEVHQRIAHRLRWNVLRQGDVGHQETVRRFREDGHAVLFGLRSFMTGVDVQGDALSLVIVDKLPFQAPDDPIYAARCAAINEADDDTWAWFRRLAIPTATLLLKQAAGRLIRSTTDRGVVALLDGRLTSKGYGTGMVRSLPPMPVTRSLDTVRAFFS